MKKKEKEKRAQLEQLRLQRNSYLDKARECVVYGDAKGYHYWLNAANETSNKIMNTNFPDGPKTARRIEDGKLIVSYTKRIIREEMGNA